MSKEKKVITITGSEQPISKCRKFENNWYLIGKTKVENSGDCYLINNKYYRFETGQVVYDHVEQEYVLMNLNLRLGLVKFDENKNAILGYFSKKDNSQEIIVRLQNGMRYPALNEDLFKDNREYRERLYDGHFYHIDTLDASSFSEIKVPKGEYKTSLPYDSSVVMEQYIKNYKDLNLEITENVEKYSPAIKDLSFGLEFETTAGVLPGRILNKTGLIPLRDGSISGIEYVSIPLEGSKGLQTIINSVKELKKRTVFNDSCALHLHIGNIPRTKEFILALFKVTCAIQEEMFELFPLYKKYNLGVKNKNYSKPYPIAQLLGQMDSIVTPGNIDYNFNVLYQYLSMGENFYQVNNNLNDVKSHPADREGRAKWHIQTRYYWLNLIPLIFGNKQTVEFRIHTSTFDVTKIMQLILLNSSIINFTIENTSKILTNPSTLLSRNNKTISLNEIISLSIHKNMSLGNDNIKDLLVEEMINYICVRKDIIYSNSSKGDIVGNEDKLIYHPIIDWENNKKQRFSPPRKKWQSSSSTVKPILSSDGKLYFSKGRDRMSIDNNNKISSTAQVFSREFVERELDEALRSSVGIKATNQGIWKDLADTTMTWTSTNLSAEENIKKEPEF